jgi:beta-1,2-mannosidase
MGRKKLLYETMKPKSYQPVALVVCCFVAASPVVFSQTTPLPDWAIGPFSRPSNVNPLIKPDPSAQFLCPMRKNSIYWESLYSFNPAAAVHDGKVFLLYRAEDSSGTMEIGMHTSRLGLGTSDDGLVFARETTPVLYPAEDQQKRYEWDGGCEDPRLIAGEDGTYVLTYTQWDRKTARLAVATTSDFIHWNKHGPAFAKAYDGRYLNSWTKSGAIVGKVQDGQLTAAKINGKYWMYWGDGQVHLASSSDLLDWTPVESEPGKLLVALAPRPGKFDSALAEGGPPAVLTEKGIVMLYNGKNDHAGGDPKLDPDAYSVGQALFDAQDPTKLLARLDEPFFKPEMPYERTGQYEAGTTFCEGLVWYHGKWLIYYGCADSFVGVAVSQ